MTDEQVDSISRLRSWIETYGHNMRPEFVRDMTTVLDMVTPKEDSPLCCTCCERDGSYVCGYCKSQGQCGHMQVANPWQT